MEEKHLRFLFALFVIIAIVFGANYILKFEIVHTILFFSFLIFLGSTILADAENQLASLTVLVLVAVGIVLSIENILQLTNISAESTFSIFQFFKVVVTIFLSAFGFLEWMFLSYPAKTLE